jgi:hypothetical protein
VKDPDPIAIDTDVPITAPVQVVCSPPITRDYGGFRWPGSTHLPTPGEQLMALCPGKLIGPGTSYGPGSAHRALVEKE